MAPSTQQKIINCSKATILQPDTSYLPLHVLSRILGDSLGWITEVVNGPCLADEVYSHFDIARAMQKVAHRIFRKGGGGGGGGGEPSDAPNLLGNRAYYNDS